MKKSSTGGMNGVKYSIGDTVRIRPRYYLQSWYHDKQWVITEMGNKMVLNPHCNRPSRRYIHIFNIEHVPTKQTTAITKQDILDIAKECWSLNNVGINIGIDPAVYTDVISAMKKIIDKRLKKLQK